ncbi:S-layer homology domain-containing protein [Thermus antranikianii]|uniref:S-layer homology domain-containing protein n=1 Tax=Thermus antranikianii TaxID=88190 RepID=UPI001C77C7F3|nr:S-layer homology domain-containing protein [Thermus antranikianii]QWK22328.1 MAG: S-layer homology domain-containing protein [Thermus antranikianii]
MKRVGATVLFLMGVAWAAFSDIPPGPLAEQVERVVAAGWLQGYPDGTFRGQEPVNRYQLAAALGRVLKDLGVEAQLVEFRDVPKGHWALEPLALAVSWGLITGYPDGTFRGTEPLTRGALAVVLAKLLDRFSLAKEAPLPWDVPANHWAASAVRKVLGTGLMDPNPDGSFGVEAKVNRYQLARALAALHGVMGSRLTKPASPSSQPAAQPAPSSPHSTAGLMPAGEGGASGMRPAPVEVMEVPGRWVGTSLGRTVVLGEEKVYRIAPGGLEEIGAASAAMAVLPPWVLKAGALEDGRQRYVPVGAPGGKGVLPPVFKNMKEGHLALDPSGNYLLLANARPLCDCPSRAVRLVLLLTNPVGLYAEYVYLLDEVGAKVAGIAWPEAKNLLVLETSGQKARLYRVNLNAGEDIAFSAWDEGGLEERSPVPVRPVAKVLVAEVPLAEAWGLGAEAPDRLLTVAAGKLVRVQLPTTLW